MSRSPAAPPSTVPPERMAEILDIAEDGVVTVDRDRRIVLFNRGAAKIFGYHPAEVLGRPLEDLLPERYRPAHPAQVASFAGGPDVSRVMGERRLVFGRRQDGTEFPAEVTISKLEGVGGTLLTAIVRDGTARKKYEDALKRLNQELEERVRERTAELADRNLRLAQKNEENETFVYSVSHDLRSPLVNLEGFSEELALSLRDLTRLLADDRIPADVRARAADLVGEAMPESVAFIRAAVPRLSRIIDALHGTATEKKAEVVVGELPPAWGDPTAVEQVFANLVGNALNYLDPARPGRVEVGAGSDGEAGRTYFVRDNGLGIPAAHLAKMFQAFQRLHPDKAAGEGMGLTIVRRILERLGGTIRVESAPRAGTTFFVTLPAGPPDRAARPGPQP